MVEFLKKNSQYFILGGVVFLLGTIWHFPLERLATILTAKAQKESGVVFRPEKLTLAFPIGLTAENLLVQLPGNQGQPISLTLDRLTLRPSILALLTYPFKRQLGFSYKVNRDQAVFSGSGRFGKENSSFDLDAKNFELIGTIPLEQAAILGGKGIDINGNLNLKLSIKGKTVAIMQRNFSEAEGFLEVRSKKLDLNLPVINQLPLSEFTVESNLQKGVAPTLTASAKGTLGVTPFFPNSQLKMDVDVKVDPQDAKLSSLMQMASMFNIRPGPDGNLSLNISGPLNSPERMSIKNL
jgi:type II secretion system protein N